MLWAGAAGSVPITPRSLDCLRRALDPDGTLAKTIACLEVFGGFGHADRVLFETHDNGELTLKLTFPPGVSEADVRQLLWDSGLDPDDHIFELASSRPTEEEPTINVVFFAPGPPKEMGFDDWFDVADQAMCDESWLDVPPSETQSFAGVRGARPDESIISENVWVDL